MEQAREGITWLKFKKKNQVVTKQVVQEGRYELMKGFSVHGECTKRIKRKTSLAMTGFNPGSSGPIGRR